VGILIYFCQESLPHMLNLLGEHHCKLDTKGRLLFPGRLRKQLEQHIHHGLVVNRDIFTKCLVIYPKPEWDRVNEEMSRLSRYNQKHQLFQRKFMKGATLVELDSNGRMLIPAALLEYAEIEIDENNECVITGLGEKMELWSASNHQDVIIDEDFDFGSLAEDVRKDIERNPNT
jgi:MraZ protein